MGYPTTPAHSGTAINKISPNSQFVIYNVGSDNEEIVWYTGEVDSEGNGTTTKTVPSGCSKAEIKAKKDQLNNDRAKALLRIERNQRLAETDWMVLSDTAEISDAWKTYRQALRDLPSTQNPTVTGSALSNVTWPTKPE
tara:strand:+ start:185 stop:601 length:417 start_codon:yes stop_codon:yes gene_type:complete